MGAHDFKIDSLGKTLAMKNLLFVKDVTSAQVTKWKHEETSAT